MNYEQEKLKLQKQIDIIERIVSEERIPDYFNRSLIALKAAVNNDFFTVVVLGEFKRGKSTLINALLGEEILPSYVTPTTQTINALMYDEEKKVEVTFSDGKKEQGEVSLEYLSKFSVSGERSAEAVHFLKIGYPMEMLSNNVVLIDTPGVSDINEQRVQVTYDFIPKSDAIIFLLDSTSPLKRTEKDFIENHLMKNGIKKVLFVANYYDHVDKDEQDEVIEEVKCRISSALKDFKKDEINVVPFSAYQALEGAKKNDKRLIEESNLNELKGEVDKLIFEGNSPENKIGMYKKRLSIIVKALINDIDQNIQLNSKSIEDLQLIVSKMNEIKLEDAERKEKLGAYALEQRNSILKITTKSLRYHQDKIQEDVAQRVNFYSGSDFKNYVEKQLYLEIQRGIHNWFENAQRKINQMQVTLYQTMMKSLARHYQTKLAFEQYREGEFKKSPISFEIQADDLSNINVHAGIAFGAVAGVAILVGLPFFIPLAGAAGIPFLQKNMLQNQLEDAKRKVIPEIRVKIDQNFDQLLNVVTQEIDKSIECIIVQTEEFFAEAREDLVNKIENDIQLRKVNQNSLILKGKESEGNKEILQEMYIELK